MDRPRAATQPSASPLVLLSMCLVAPSLLPSNVRIFCILVAQRLLALGALLKLMLADWLPLDNVTCKIARGVLLRVPLGSPDLR